MTRKYPRLPWADWNALSKEERANYATLAARESLALRAAKAAAKDSPKDLSYHRPQVHPWRIDYAIKSVAGSYVNNGVSDMGSVLYVQSRTGFTNPKWKQQVAAFQNATTAYSLTSGLVKDAPGSFVLDYYHGTDRRRATMSGDFARQVLPSISASSTAAESISRVDFYKKLKKTQQKFGGGVFLGELRETAALVRKPYVEIPRLIKNYTDRAKGIIKAPRKSLTWTQREKKVADAWLTATFGILPLVSDVQDAADALASLFDSEQQKRVSGIGRDWNQSSLTSVQCYNPGGGAYVCGRMAREEKADVLVKYTGGVHVRAVGPNMSSLPDISRRFGFSVKEFVPTFYELLPWSFLLDYVTSVGDVLNAWAVSYSSVKWQCRVELHKRVAKTSLVYDEAETKARVPGLVTGVGYLGSCTSYLDTYVRSNPGQVPLPVLEFRSALSPVKVMNVIALRQNLVRELRDFLPKAHYF
jgi:hypothetical protein